MQATKKNFFFNLIDIDECLINNGECDINANCVNTIGSRNCTCHDGFSGNGTNCLGIIIFSLFKKIVVIIKNKNRCE